MQFDPDNHVVKLCAEGMSLEGEGKHTEAAKLFHQAWAEASDDFEKFTAAHYVARHQNDVSSKLTWDETALYFALRIKDDTVKESLPSLYLNIAKCYEDLQDTGNALKNYEIALEYAQFLPKNGYGDMIRSGIENGINRMTLKRI